MRPEIIGFVLGALIAAYLFKEFRPRAGSAPLVRFILGAFAMIGALVFIGCPDVPYLAQGMVGQTMAEAPSPREIGHTLCGYALQLAYEETRRKCWL